MSELDPRRARVFGAHAEEYERWRPDYPAEAVAWLLPPGARRVADVGAGTGKLTAGLLAQGVEVVAVEPDPGMLAVLRRTYPAADAHLAGAERLPLPDRSVDAVTAGQAWHWFPPDRTVAEVRRVLRPGGRYVCLTPNRLDGPHDVSAHFDDEATGFHLKEYTTRDLRSLFEGAGFSGMQVLLKVRARTFVLPAAPLALVEGALDRLPPARRRQVARSVLVRKFLGRVIATA